MRISTRACTIGLFPMNDAVQQLVSVQVRTWMAAAVLGWAVVAGASCRMSPPPWELENPVVPLPAGPLGTEIDLAALPDPPTPERVRLGRWLFYDTRLSADNTVACASCHRPQHAFSEP